MVFDVWCLNGMRNGKAALRGVETGKECLVSCETLVEAMNTDHLVVFGLEMRRGPLEFSRKESVSVWGIDEEEDRIVSAGDRINELMSGNGDIPVSELESGDLVSRNGKLWLFLKNFSVRTVSMNMGLLETNINDIGNIFLSINPLSLVGEKYTFLDEVRRRITGFDSIAGKMSTSEILNLLKSFDPSSSGERDVFLGSGRYYRSNILFIDTSWDRFPIPESISFSIESSRKESASFMDDVNAFVRGEDVYFVYFDWNEGGYFFNRYTKEKVDRAASSTVNVKIPPDSSGEIGKTKDLEAWIKNLGLLYVLEWKPEIRKEEK